MSYQYRKPGERKIQTEYYGRVDLALSDLIDVRWGEEEPRKVWREGLEDEP